MDASAVRSDPKAPSMFRPSPRVSAEEDTRPRPVSNAGKDLQRRRKKCYKKSPQPSRPRIPEEDEVFLAGDFHRGDRLLRLALFRPFSFRLFTGSLSTPDKGSVAAN